MHIARATRIVFAGRLAATRKPGPCCSLAIRGLSPNRRLDLSRRSTRNGWRRDSIPKSDGPRVRSAWGDSGQFFDQVLKARHLGQAPARAPNTGLVEIMLHEALREFVEPEALVAGGSTIPVLGPGKEQVQEVEARRHHTHCAFLAEASRQRPARSSGDEDAGDQLGWVRQLEGSSVVCLEVATSSCPRRRDIGRCSSVGAWLGRRDATEASKPVLGERFGAGSAPCYWIRKESRGPKFLDVSLKLN